MPHLEARREQKKRKRVLDKSAKSWDDKAEAALGANGSKKEMSNMEKMLTHAMVEHMGTMMQPGRVYSVAPSCVQVARISERLAPHSVKKMVNAAAARRTRHDEISQHRRTLESDGESADEAPALASTSILGNASMPLVPKMCEDLVPMLRPERPEPDAEAAVQEKPLFSPWWTQSRRLTRQFLCRQQLGEN